MVCEFNMNRRIIMSDINISYVGCAYFTLFPELTLFINIILTSFNTVCKFGQYSWNAFVIGLYRHNTNEWCILLKHIHGSPIPIHSVLKLIYELFGIL